MHGYAAGGALRVEGRSFSRRAIENARGKAPIAQTLDRDLGLVTRDLANLRAPGHTSVDLETQCLGGRLRIGRNSNVDEISHLDLPVSIVVSELRTYRRRQERCWPPARSRNISRQCRKESS